MTNLKEKTRIWIEPTADFNCACVQGNKNYCRLSYYLPDVNRNNIELKISGETLNLYAKKDDTEYFNEFTFYCTPANKTINSTFENGCLVIDIPLACSKHSNDWK